MTPDPKKIIAELMEKQAAAPDLTKLTSRLMDKFGGLEGFADALHGDYDAAPEGSSQRAILGRAFLELIKETQPVGADDPADVHTPEELVAAAGMALRRSQDE
jgi:hypothetical protein